MPKRILHFRGSSSLLGAERVVLELAQWSPTFGYEPLIVAPNERDAPTPEFISAARSAGIDAMTLPCDGRLDWHLLRQLRQLVRRQGIDIIHCHGYKEDVHAALAGLGIPLIATNHLWKRTTRALRLYCWLDGLILRRFDEIIAVSDPILDDMRQCSVPEAKLSKIANGIDMRRFETPLQPAERAAVRAGLGLEADAVVVGMLSSLTPEKGHAFALDAMTILAAEFPQVQLCIVGDGGLGESLRARVRSVGLESRIIFAGRRSDIPQVLGSFDVFVLPSLNEGLPMALLEAMAAGLPAVASEVGDVGQAIEDGVSGRLVPPGSSPDLLNALRPLVASAELRRRLGDGARRRVAKHFSSRAMTEAYCRIYDHALHASGETEVETEPLEREA